MKAKQAQTLPTRSNCPVSCTLELIGDKWSLLIIRDMMLFGKNSYNEFLNSEEGISTNILNDRLLRLTELKLITYTGSAKRKIYWLTPLGMDLKPVLEAVARFGMRNFKNTKKYSNAEIKHLLRGRAKVLDRENSDIKAKRK